MALAFISCSTFSGTNQGEEASRPDYPAIISSSESRSVQTAISELEKVLDELDGSVETSRDIDNRDWLMSFINHSADKDMLIVQTIYENLRYKNWTSEEKARYIQHYSSVKSGTPAGFLVEMRKSVWDEIFYLINNSHLLQDSPWLVRDFYDERSEFSYWYMIYLARLSNPFWIEESILPELLKLIPEDRVNGVAYLWLKKPESLCSMKKEIIDTGYPWNTLLRLMDMNDYIQKEISSLNVEESEKTTGACLF